MKTVNELKNAADLANAYVLRVINAGCTKATMLKAQAARDAAEAAYFVAFEADKFEAARDAKADGWLEGYEVNFYPPMPPKA